MQRWNNWFAQNIMNYKTNCLPVWCPTFCKTAVKHCSAEAGQELSADWWKLLQISSPWVLSWIIHRIAIIPLKMIRKIYLWPICFCLCDPDAGQTQRSCRLHFADLNVKKPSHWSPLLAKPKWLLSVQKQLFFSCWAEIIEHCNYGTMIGTSLSYIHWSSHICKQLLFTLFTLFMAQFISKYCTLVKHSPSLNILS